MLVFVGNLLADAVLAAFVFQLLLLAGLALPPRRRGAGRAAKPLTLLLYRREGDPPLSEALARALSCSCPVVVVDDASTDGAAVAPGSQAVVVRNGRTLGRARSLDLGLGRVQTELVAVLDPRAFATAEALGAAAAELDDPRVAACAVPARARGPRGFTAACADVWLLSVSVARLAFGRLGLFPAIGGPLVVYRRSALVEAGGFSGRGGSAGALARLTVSGYRARFAATIPVELETRGQASFRRSALAVWLLALALAVQHWTRRSDDPLLPTIPLACAGANLLLLYILARQRFLYAAPPAPASDAPAACELARHAWTSEHSALLL
ncbi:MAG: glycosyltransferase, partial [Elusimicrobia bacterium]|nr:glycosyltransferase [Elusimicrobiota bacterium]